MVGGGRSFFGHQDPFGQGASQADAAAGAVAASVAQEGHDGRFAHAADPHDGAFGQAHGPQDRGVGSFDAAGDNQPVLPGAEGGEWPGRRVNRQGRGRGMGVEKGQWCQYRTK